MYQRAARSSLRCDGTRVHDPRAVVALIVVLSSPATGRHRYSVGDDDTYSDSESGFSVVAAAGYEWRVTRQEDSKRYL